MADWLSIDDLSLRYGRRPVFAGLSLTLPDTSPVLAVAGASGIGKSTLIALLAGHIRPDGGTITLCGEPVTGPSARRPVVFQDHNLLPWKTVLDNVVFGLKCRGVPPQERVRQGRSLLARMCLDDVRGDYPATLSGGMRQRVGLARAMAVEPACLLLDEAFHALDIDNRETLRNDVVGLVAAGNVRAVVVTHDLDEALLMATTVLVVRGPGDVSILDLSALPWPRPAGWRGMAPFPDAAKTLRGLITRPLPAAGRINGLHWFPAAPHPAHNKGGFE